MMTTLTTCLRDWHASHDAKMVDFAGWLMPIQYTSIVAEHQATRNHVGLFDISHMGRLTFDGDAAEPFLESLLTRRVAGMEPGRIRYSLMTNDDGGILDDVLVYNLTADSAQPAWMLVVNAGNREKIVAWIESHVAGSPDVRWADTTLDTCMVAVQGPQAIATVNGLVETSVANMRYYTGTQTTIVGDVRGIVSRTGYTGEDGCELIVPAADGPRVWQAILDAGADYKIAPVGLGARDTLRLEAAMPLYGHELSEQTDPFTANLSFAVNLPDRTFPGCDVLAQKKMSAQRKRIGLTMAGRRVPREGYAVKSGDRVVGEVTSGTFSPTLQRPIAMAYVEPELASPGESLAVDIRGRLEAAAVVELPFYSRPK